MDTTKRSPLDRLLFSTFLKGRTSSRDVWEEKGDMTPEDNQKIIEETNEIINDDSTYPYLSYLTNLLAKSKPSGDAVKKLHDFRPCGRRWRGIPAFGCKPPAGQTDSGPRLPGGAHGIPVPPY